MFSDALKQLKTGYEAVFTVEHYWDGPVSGVANYSGKPHFYERMFDKAADEYSDLFLLSPIDEGTFSAAMEDWAIWLRWEEAFHSGKTNLSSHPALPKDQSRHNQLKSILAKGLVIDPAQCIKRVGKFEAIGPTKLPRSTNRSLQVEWPEP